MNLKKIWGGFLVFLGFWLSPLTPWNDLFFNIPIAYAFALLVSFVSESFFLPSFVIGYWMSNVLGFILMDYGYVHIRERKYSFANRWKPYLLATTLYTVLIVLLVHFGILPSAQEVMALID